MNVTIDHIGSYVGAPQFTNRKMAVIEKNNPTSSPDHCPDLNIDSDHDIFLLLSWKAWSVCALSFDLSQEVLQRHNHNNSWIRFWSKWNSLLLSHLLASTFSVPKDYCANYHPPLKLISLKYTDIFLFCRDETVKFIKKKLSHEAEGCIKFHKYVPHLWFGINSMWTEPVQIFN